MNMSNIAIPPITLGLFRDLVVASVGAFIAYYAWNRYQSPSLHFSGIEKKEVVSSGDDERSRFRAVVTNSGNIPAKGCEIQVWLEGKIDSSSVAVTNYQAGWVDKGGDVFVGDDFATKKITIGPNETAESDLLEYRHHPDGGQLTPGYIIGNKNQSWTVIDSSEEDHIEKAIFNGKTLIHDGEYVDHKPHITLTENFDYINAGVRVTSENSSDISEDMEIEWNEKGACIRMIDISKFEVLKNYFIR